MREFQHRFQVAAPIELVAAFHKDSRALKLLNPPPLMVSFNYLQPLAEDSITDFTLWFGPFPVRWVAKHSEVNFPKGFVDTQIQGPYTTWIHRHSFVAMGSNTTEIIDQIQAQPGEKLFWGILSRLMWLNLPILFSYRAWRTRRAVEVK